MMNIDQTGQQNQPHADTPAEPEHPMMLKGGVVPGDVELMIRCMTEELLQVGISPTELSAMSHDPNYQAFYAARAVLGDRIDEILRETHQRIGTFRHHTVEQTGTTSGVTLTVQASS